MVINNTNVEPNIGGLKSPPENKAKPDNSQ